MLRTHWLGLTVLVWGIGLAPSAGHAQSISPFVPTAPEPPVSLYSAPASAPPAFPIDSPLSPRPAPDPLLDPPPMPPPGPLVEAQLSILFPHLHNMVAPDADSSDPLGHGFPVPTVGPGGTVSPRLALGYRLPDAWGEVFFAYRNLTSEGRGLVTDYVAGPAQVTTRLNQNFFDLIYGSREPSLLPGALLRWEFGGRYGYSYWDSRAVNAIGRHEISSRFDGGGLVAAVSVTRCLGQGLDLFARGESGSLMGGSFHHAFASEFDDTGSIIASGACAVSFAFAQSVDFQLGLGWVPPWAPRSRFSAGYEFYQWWLFVDQGLNSNVTAHGLFVRWELSF